MIRTVILVIALVTLTACQSERDVSDSDPGSVPGSLRIEVYSTGETPVADVERHLKAVFPSGNYRALPNGRIAVAASVSQQPSIGKLIEQLGRTEPEPPSQIRIRQWLVEATPAENVMVPDNLVYLEKPLTDTATLTGSLSFKRLEQVEFRVLEGGQGRTSGKMLDVSADARQIVSDTILLGMKIHSRPTGSYLETEMSIESGERVVMGMLEHSDQEAMLLLVLEAEIL